MPFNVGIVVCCGLFVFARTLLYSLLFLRLYIFIVSFSRKELTCIYASALVDEGQIRQ